MLMLDLFSGLGGASSAMRERGWDVITVDNNPEFNPDYLADITSWSWDGDRPDLVWASPPCIEFARESMPWSRTGNKPSMTLVNAAKRIINEVKPRYWIIENVRGAIPYLGRYRDKIGPFYLWGHFPQIGNVNTDGWKKKESYGSKQSAERAKIPYELSLAVALAIEHQPALFEFVGCSMREPVARLHSPSHAAWVF